ncbi:DNA polymerase III, delta prime subunit [Thermincola ferriacetica]|uniref:DNA polymerase III subunit delta' n=1 Tax=Thermincola ferriacetica TaxID=281456 RepID=A0A0L6W272_9FIRM|nr:DNA polymerase III subunit delta' [Thermincola ferriacetica]KNZ69179.1 DNA polymerase III, delta prime subunit [Thermincola ferriacetica]
MWQQIVGHETVIKTLINALNNKKVAHAYLLTGPRGLGKETIARTFAQAFFCEREESIPCDQCSNCKRLQEGNYPDFHIIEPIGNAIKIEQIRNIQKSCQYKPYEGIGRVYLIKNAEAMTVESANCLLKVLEEPNENTVFLLTAENPYMLLPTVLSRCQRLNLRPVPPSVLADWLIKQGLDSERARVISALSDGAPGKALNLISPKEPDRRETVVAKAAQIQRGDVITALRIAEDMEKDKDAVKEDLDLLATWYRDLLVWAKTRETRLLINLDFLDEIKKQALGLDINKIGKDLNDIMKTRRNIQSNVNLKLSLETLLLKLSKSA